MEEQCEEDIVNIREWPVTDIKLSASELTSSIKDPQSNVQECAKKSTLYQFRSESSGPDRPSKIPRYDGKQEPSVPNVCSSDTEPLVQVRIARWWRKNRQLSEARLPKSHNPNTTLFHIAQTQDCRAYLKVEKQMLCKKASIPFFKDRADIHAAIASIDDCLGNYDSAIENISHALELEPDNTEYRWLREKLKKQYQTINIQEEKLKLMQRWSDKFPPVCEVEKISSKDLDFGRFWEKYVKGRTPVILLDVVKEMTTEPWNLDYIKTKAGSFTVTVKQRVPQSVEWARLEESRKTTMGQFIDQVQKGETDDYLFDWSLPLHCPDLVKDLTIPKFFAGNFLHRTTSGSLYHDSWPSLFIAPKGAKSDLHIDAFASNFWMALFQGRKRWTFFDGADAPLLYPQYIHSMDPVFRVDLSEPDVHQFPLLTLTKPKQCILEPGELLFVPAGSPHYVENLTVSLAISSNHVDQSNYKQVCEELRINSWLDPRAADLLQQLENPDFLCSLSK